MLVFQCLYMGVFGGRYWYVLYLDRCANDHCTRRRRLQSFNDCRSIHLYNRRFYLNIQKFFASLRQWWCIIITYFQSNNVYKTHNKIQYQSSRLYNIMHTECHYYYIDVRCVKSRARFA